MDLVSELMLRFKGKNLKLAQCFTVHNTHTDTLTIDSGCLRERNRRA